MNPSILRLKAVLKQHDGVRLWLEATFEIVIVVAFLKAYNVTRNLFGSQACSPALALANADQIILLERMLGMFWEQEIQDMGLRLPVVWIRAWNVYYGSAHMAVTVRGAFIRKLPAF